MARVRRLVKAVSGITLVKRVNVTNGTIPDVTSADFDNPLTIDLLECVEAQDQSQVSNGSVVADAPLYSRITSINLRGVVQGTASGVNFMRWILFKSPDNDLSGAEAMTDWHTSTESEVASILRKNTLAKGVLVTGASSTVGSLRCFVSRQALKRVAPLREDDVIRLAIAKDAAGTTARLELYGDIRIRANG